MEVAVDEELFTIVERVQQYIVVPLFFIRRTTAATG